MRKARLERLVAGTMLALIVATPTLSVAAPDRVESIAPPPGMLNGQSRRREADPMPPRLQRIISVPEKRAQAPTEPETKNDPKIGPKFDPPARVEAPAVAPREAATDFKSAVEKSFAASNAQIGEKLRDIVTGRGLERRVNRTPERKTIETYYASHGYAPLWIRDGRLTANAQLVIAQLMNAGADGLDTSDYPVPEFGSLINAEALADGDIRLTNSVLTYAHHLAVGRVAPTRVSAEVDYGTHLPEPADILKKVTEARDAGAALESFNPPQDGFRALKRKLADLRANPGAVEPDNRIPEGPAIRPGAKDARIPALRARLGVAGEPDDRAYDRTLFNAIRNVQQHSDIKVTGVIDGKTLAAVNGPKQIAPAAQIDRIIANMERWRWLPRDLGKTYVMVNIPDYTLKVVHDNNIQWRTKIVAGKPQTPTPLLSAPMQEVIVNPSWFVPQSIIQNELLPQFASDPHIFDRMGLEVKRGSDGHINVVQPPGAANALGRIKFTFPNKFQVYLHDTPEKRLFASEKRAFSHGCMRVENPTKFGEVMLSLAMPGSTPSAHTLDALVGHEEKVYKLITQPTVHLTYQTAYVEDGRLVLRDDIYGFDARINSIMHSDERRIADLAPPQDAKRDAATAKSNQEILSRVERREAQNPFSFFERVFR